MRSAAQLVVLTPFLIQAGPAAFRTQHMRLHATRGLLSVLGLFAFFYSYAHLPLASAVSISFARNLFIVAFAAIVLGETELARDVAMVRDMKTGEQVEVPLAELEARLAGYR